MKKIEREKEWPLASGDSKCDEQIFLLSIFFRERAKFVEIFFCAILVQHFSVWKLLNHFIPHLHLQQITDCSRSLAPNGSKLINFAISWPNVNCPSETIRFD